MRASEILLEMKIAYEEEDYNFLVAFKGDIWLIDEEEPDEEAIQDIANKTGVDFEHGIREAFEERPDIFCGYISDDTIYIDGTRMGQSPYSSNLIKKVVQHLGLEVELEVYNDDDIDTTEVDAEEIIGKIPNEMYHGTSTGWLPQILKYGLRPTEHTNWSKGDGGNPIKTDNVFFMTATPDTAKFHARNATENYNGYNNNKAVILFKIPDRNKIGLDYDTIRAVYGQDSDDIKGTAFQNIKDHPFSEVEKASKYRGKTDVNAQIGNFSYAGRVPSSFFRAIYIYDENEGEWVELDVKDTKRYLAWMDELGDYDGGFSLATMVRDYTDEELNDEFGMNDEEEDDY